MSQVPLLFLLLATRAPFGSSDVDVVVVAEGVPPPLPIIDGEGASWANSRACTPAATIPDDGEVFPDGNDREIVTEAGGDIWVLGFPERGRLEGGPLDVLLSHRVCRNLGEARQSALRVAWTARVDDEIPEVLFRGTAAGVACASTAGIPAGGLNPRFNDVRCVEIDDGALHTFASRDTLRAIFADDVGVSRIALDDDTRPFFFDSHVQNAFSYDDDGLVLLIQAVASFTSAAGDIAPTSTQSVLFIESDDGVTLLAGPVDDRDGAIVTNMQRFVSAPTFGSPTTIALPLPPRFFGDPRQAVAFIDPRRPAVFGLLDLQAAALGLHLIGQPGDRPPPLLLVPAQGRLLSYDHQLGNLVELRPAADHDLDRDGLGADDEADAVSDAYVFDSDGGGSCDGGEVYFAGSDAADASDDEPLTFATEALRSPLLDMLFPPLGFSEGAVQPLMSFPSSVACRNGVCVDANGDVVVDLSERVVRLFDIPQLDQIRATPDGSSLVFRDGTSFIAHDLATGDERVLADQADVDDALDGALLRWWEPGADDVIWFGSFVSVNEVSLEVFGAPCLGVVRDGRADLVLDRRAIDCELTPGSCDDGAPTDAALVDLATVNIYPIGLDRVGRHAIVRIIGGLGDRVVALDDQGDAVLLAEDADALSGTSLQAIGWRTDGRAYAGFSFPRADGTIDTLGDGVSLLGLFGRDLHVHGLLGSIGVGVVGAGWGPYGTAGHFADLEAHQLVETHARLEPGDVVSALRFGDTTFLVKAPPAGGAMLLLSFPPIGDARHTIEFMGVSADSVCMVDDDAVYEVAVDDAAIADDRPVLVEVSDDNDARGCGYDDDGDLYIVDEDRIVDRSGATLAALPRPPSRVVPHRGGWLVETDAALVCITADGATTESAGPLHALAPLRSGRVFVDAAGVAATVDGDDPCQSAVVAEPWTFPADFVDGGAAHERGDGLLVFGEGDRLISRLDGRSGHLYDSFRGTYSTPFAVVPGDQPCDVWADVRVPREEGCVRHFVPAGEPGAAEGEGEGEGAGEEGGNGCGCGAVDASAAGFALLLLLRRPRRRG